MSTTKRKPGKPKANRAEQAEILDFVESAMVRRLSERQIIKLARERFGLGERQTYRDIGYVRARWSAEASATAREERRDHLRKSLEDSYAKAMTTTATKPDPDVRSAVRSAKLLMDLDALAIQPRQIVELSGVVGVGAASIPNSTREGLEAWLKGGTGKP